MVGFSRSAADVTQLREAIGKVADPELHLPLAELDMIRSVSCNRSGNVEVEVVHGRDRPVPLHHPAQPDR